MACGALADGSAPPIPKLGMTMTSDHWTDLMELACAATSPEEVAEKLAQSHDAQWLRSVITLLEKSIQRSLLERLLTLWNLTGSEAGQLFGISRQAFNKWLENGPPANRLFAIAALSDATDLLERHLQRDRIPVVVRRISPLSGNKSLIELASAGKYDTLLNCVRDMFDLRRIQP